MDPARSIFCQELALHDALEVLVSGLHPVTVFIEHGMPVPHLQDAGERAVLLGQSLRRLGSLRSTIGGQGADGPDREPDRTRRPVYGLGLVVLATFEDGRDVPPLAQPAHQGAFDELFQAEDEWYGDREREVPIRERVAHARERSTRSRGRVQVKHVRLPSGLAEYGGQGFGQLGHLQVLGQGHRGAAFGRTIGTLGESGLVRCPRPIQVVREEPATCLQGTAVPTEGHHIAYDVALPLL